MGQYFATPRPFPPAPGTRVYDCDCRKIGQCPSNHPPFPPVTEFIRDENVHDENAIPVDLPIPRPADNWDSDSGYKQMPSKLRRRDLEVARDMYIDLAVKMFYTLPVEKQAALIEKYGGNELFHGPNEATSQESQRLSLDSTTDASYSLSASGNKEQQNEALFQSFDGPLPLDGSHATTPTKTSPLPKEKEPPYPLLPADGIARTPEDWAIMLPSDPEGEASELAKFEAYQKREGIEYLSLSAFMANPDLVQEIPGLLGDVKLTKLCHCAERAISRAVDKLSDHSISMIDDGSDPNLQPWERYRRADQYRALVNLLSENWKANPVKPFLSLPTCTVEDEKVNPENCKLDEFCHRIYDDAVENIKQKDQSKRYIPEFEELMANLLKASWGSDPRTLEIARLLDGAKNNSTYTGWNSTRLPGRLGRLVGDDEWSEAGMKAHFGDAYADVTVATNFLYMSMFPQPGLTVF